MSGQIFKFRNWRTSLHFTVSEALPVRNLVSSETSLLLGSFVVWRRTTMPTATFATVGVHF